MVELFGISDRIRVLRKGTDLANLLKNKEIEDADLQVRS